MALYTPVNPDLNGAAPNLVAVAATDTFQNNGKMLLHVHNGSGGSVTVTVDDPTSASPANALSFNPDIQVSVPAGQDRYIGPFPPNRFNTESGIVTVTYSAQTSVTAEVIDCA